MHHNLSQQATQRLGYLRSMLYDEVAEVAIYSINLFFFPIISLGQMQSVLAR